MLDYCAVTLVPLNEASHQTLEVLKTHLLYLTNGWVPMLVGDGKQKLIEQSVLDTNAGKQPS